MMSASVQLDQQPQADGDAAIDDKPAFVDEIDATFAILIGTGSFVLFFCCIANANCVSVRVFQTRRRRQLALYRPTM